MGEWLNFNLIILILVLVSIVILVYIIIPPLDYSKKISIKDIATRDLTHMGRYDNTLESSIKIWVYSIEAALYMHGHRDNYLDVFINWNKNNNYDPKGIIENAIQAGHSAFLNDVESARENNVEVSFNVSNEYDWHTYPLSFYTNEYIKPDVLISDIEEIFGGD